MGFVDRPEDEDIAPKPRMKPIQEFSADVKWTPDLGPAVKV